ncbi:MAG: PhoU domain-containing protein [Candidatus Omnitrophica bacterium]|nr:PhoU domain-containing protein [Candidatus Omnitrophota bacterium]
MRQLAEIKKEIAGMAGLALEMWQMTYRSFMDHDLELLGGVLEKENSLNDLEKRLTQGLVELGRASGKKEEKHAITIYADVVGDLELIGDYCKDVLERVQIKIEEKLLFSDDAVKEYSELYRKTEHALTEVVNALARDDLTLIKAVLKNEEHIDSLVDEYRRRHTQRLLDGVCSPLACNMFLNMVDFSAAVYYHTKKIARNLLKVKL